MKLHRKHFSFLLYNLVVVLVILGSIELGVTYFLNHPEKISEKFIPHFKKYYVEVDRHITHFEEEFTNYSEDLFYTLKPGTFTFENREFSNEFTVNSMGLRDDEESLNGPEIIVIGDSYTMGWGVDQDESFPQIIEKNLNKKVLNAGISSYGTAREIALLEKLDRSKLQTLIIQYCGNDETENNVFYANDNQLQISSSEVYNKIKTSANEVNEYYFMKHTMLLGNSIVFNKEYTTYQAIESFDPLKYATTVDLNDAVLFLNVLNHSEAIQEIPQIIITFLDTKPSNLFIQSLRSELSNIKYKALREKITLLDVSEVLASDDYYILDKHVKPSFHAKLGDYLSDLIQNQKIDTEKSVLLNSKNSFDIKKEDWVYDENLIADGRYEMDSTVEWGPTLKFDLSAEQLQDGFTIIEAAYTYSGDSDSSGLLVVSVDHKGENLFWYGGNHEYNTYQILDSSSVLTLNRIDLKELVPKIDSFATVSVFYWNQKKNHAFIDDFAVTLRRQQAIVYQFKPNQ